MALKQINTNIQYVKWAEVAPGTPIQGFYMEMKLSDKYKNQIHYIETLEGKRYGLNGNANLDRAFEQIRQGWYFELVYQGTIIMESGKYPGKECHQYTIAYDDERIHPYFSGDAKAREEVAYKNSVAAPAAAPPNIVKPEAPTAVTPVQPAAAVTQPAAQPVAAGASAPKRSIF